MHSGARSDALEGSLDVSGALHDALWEAAREDVAAWNLTAERDSLRWYSAHAANMPRLLRLEFLRMLGQAREQGLTFEFWDHFQAGSIHRFGTLGFDTEFAPMYTSGHSALVGLLRFRTTVAQALSAATFRLGRMVALAERMRAGLPCRFDFVEQREALPHLLDVEHGTTAPRGPNRARMTRTHSPGRVVQLAA